MDIIPINPAPQQGSPLHSDGLQTGSAETGFGEILGQTTPKTNPSVVPGKKGAPHLSSFKQSSSLDPEEQSEIALNKFFPVSDISQDSLVKNSLNDTEMLSANSRPEGDKNNEFILITTPHEHVAEGESEGSSHTNVWQFSGSFPDNPTAEPDNPEPHNNRAVHQLNEFLGLFSGNQTHFELNELPSAGLQPKGSSEFPVADEMLADDFPLALNSTASAFSIKSTETVSITVEKTFIATEREGLPLYLKSSLEGKSGLSFPHSSQPWSALPFPAHHHSNNVLETPFAGRAFSDSPHTSGFANGHPDITFTGQTSNGGQPSIMLGELQKLINQNNDKLNIDVSFETRMTSRKTIGYLVRPAIQQNPESQINSNDILSKANDGSAASTILNSSEMQPLFSKEPMPDSLRETSHQQVFNSKSTAQEKNIENNNQSLQQNSNSQDNGTLQKQSATAAQNSSTGSTEQAANSTFTSQFHELGSSQPAEAVKMGPSPSPHLSLVHDQEIINQIVERFSVQSRLQTSRLSLQLNPAELGELKIEIIVKGDVLKANLYAQTNKAAEIIDKNLNRLKEILESQGISVEDLNVFFKSDTIDDFTSQHGQLFQDQTRFLKSQPKTPTTSTFEIEDTLLTGTDDQSGVNLTI